MYARYPRIFEVDEFIVGLGFTQFDGLGFRVVYEFLATSPK